MRASAKANDGANDVLIPPNSVIRRSGQTWKLWLAIGAMTLGGIMMFIGLANLQRSGLWPLSLFFGGIVLNMLGLAFGALFVRCPACNNKWLWSGISSKPLDSWLPSVLDAAACPACGERTFVHDESR